jgi:hypothetical protein
MNSLSLFLAAVLFSLFISSGCGQIAASVAAPKASAAAVASVPLDDFPVSFDYPPIRNTTDHGPAKAEFFSELRTIDPRVQDSAPPARDERFVDEIDQAMKNLRESE